MNITEGLGVFASSFAATLDTSAADRAKYQSGADLRLTVFHIRIDLRQAGFSVMLQVSVESSCLHLHSVLLELIFPQRLEVPLRI